jgi:hypothetical protein
MESIAKRVGCLGLGVGSSTNRRKQSEHKRGKKGERSNVRLQVIRDQEENEPGWLGPVTRFDTLNASPRFPFARNLQVSISRSQSPLFAIESLYNYHPYQFCTSSGQARTTQDLGLEICDMGKQTGNTDATPARPPPSLKKQTSSSTQRSIQSFFTKSSPANGSSTTTPTNGALKVNGTGSAANAMAKPKSIASVKKPAFKKPAMRNATPVASSDAVGPSSSQENENGGIDDEDMLTLLSPAKKIAKKEIDEKSMVMLGSSPSRKASRK